MERTIPLLLLKSTAFCRKLGLAYVIVKENLHFQKHAFFQTPIIFLLVLNQTYTFFPPRKASLNIWGERRPRPLFPALALVLPGGDHRHSFSFFQSRPLGFPWPVPEGNIHLSHEQLPGEWWDQTHTNLRNCKGIPGAQEHLAELEMWAVAGRPLRGQNSCS